MTNRHTLLPALLIVVIALLAIIAMSSGPSNAPDVAVDRAYPHYICTFNSYCAGEDCQRDIDQSVIAYISHEDGKPRLEIPRMSPRATLTEVPDGLAFESTGGAVEGSLTVFTGGRMDFTATSVEDGEVIEHFASGRCGRLKTP